MYCNQSFGNSFSTPQYYSPLQTQPALVNSGLYTDLVGEGDVTCVTLPDGTVQYFFTPKIKWNQYAPPQSYNNITNESFNGVYWSPNNGSWLIRSIITPGTASIPNNCQHSELKRTPHHSVYGNDFMAFRIEADRYKFHNNSTTSTSDIHWFSPGGLLNVQNLNAQHHDQNYAADLCCCKQCKCSLKRSHDGTVSDMSLGDIKIITNAWTQTTHTLSTNTDLDIREQATGTYYDGDWKNNRVTFKYSYIEELQRQILGDIKIGTNSCTQTTYTVSTSTDTDINESTGQFCDLKERHATFQNDCADEPRVKRIRKEYNIKNAECDAIIYDEDTMADEQKTLTKDKML